ncbi:MAG TPA: transcriptional regulator [Alphaproteobacteria bacterium]|nr:transcriptional regulator [Alphaproteobacteria bacterium]
MSQTIRQMILDILLEGPATAKELSARVHIPEKDVLLHLAHIRKSLHHGQQRLVMDPASCRTCGFVFRKRERLRKPGRCPSCHHSFLEAPIFRIQASGEAGRSSMG